MKTKDKRNSFVIMFLFPNFLIQIPWLKNHRIHYYINKFKHYLLLSVQLSLTESAVLVYMP